MNAPNIPRELEQSRRALQRARVDITTLKLANDRLERRAFHFEKRATKARDELVKMRADVELMKAEVERLAAEGAQGRFAVAALDEARDLVTRAMTGEFARVELGDDLEAAIAWIQNAGLDPRELGEAVAALVAMAYLDDQLSKTEKNIDRR